MFGSDVLFRLIGPYKRGFFCDDGSIRLPYQTRSQTISMVILMGFCFGVTALTVIFC